MILRRLEVALALAGLMAAAPACAEDLLEIYREAVARDPVLASARASWLATQERLPQARSALAPQVSASGNATATTGAFYANTSPSFNQRNEYGGLNLAVSASQPLYRKQSLIAVDQAKQQLEQSDLVLLQQQQDLIIRVAQAYFDVLLAQDTLKVVDALKAATTLSLEQAKRNFEVGVATITDTNEAQARYDQILAQEIAAQNDLNNKRAALRQIIGRLPRELKPLGPGFQVRLPEPMVLDHWSQRAFGGNYGVRISQVGYDISTLEVDRLRAAREPTVDLFGSLSAGYNNGSLAVAYDTWSRQAQIGVQVAVPLYTGGFIDSRVREALATQDRTRQDLESARRVAVLQAQQSFLGVTSGAAQVRALEQAVESGRTAVASNRLGQEVGVRTNLDVLNVEGQLAQTARDLAAARYSFLLNALRLWQAVGELDEEKLTRVNAALAFP
jgi:outer membrane protein